MKSIRCLTFLAVVAFAGSNAFAQETSSEKSEGQDAQCQAGETCPIMAEAMKQLPQMTFQVGDEQTCCSESATALAKKADMPIHFVVARKTYEDKTAAYTALVEKTESFVDEFVTPCKCDESGTTTVAGKSCKCPVTSAQNAELVNTAVDQVKMTWQVGDETCDCPMKAKAMAKAADGQVEFVVADQKTSCELTARLNLAKAKYQAAVAAINSADSESEDASESGS